MDLFSDDRGSFGLEMDVPGWLKKPWALLVGPRYEGFLLWGSKTVTIARIMTAIIEIFVAIAKIQT